MEMYLFLHKNILSINNAIEIIENIVREAEIGQVYLATVRRIGKFGAFVELFPGQMH